MEENANKNAVTEDVIDYRGKLRERYGAKYPDKSYDDDDAIVRQAYEDYEEYDSEMEAYRGRENALSEMLATNPKSANFLISMKDGKDPVVALIEEFGDEFKEALDDPSKLEEIAAAHQKFLDRVATDKKYEEEYNRNLEQSLKDLDEFVTSEGIEDDKIEEGMTLLKDIVSEYVLGKITPDTLKIIFRAISYENDIENAEKVAEVRGRNAKIETLKKGAVKDDEDMYSKEIDAKIVKIRPMSTPIDTISRYASSEKTGSFEVKYNPVGTRPITTTLAQKVERQTSGTNTVLHVADPTIFTLDDTIRVVGVKGITDNKGTPFSSSDPRTPDLVLCVCGTQPETGMPLVYAVNGHVSNGQPIWLPEIQQDTVLVRMGKACGQLDVQTGCFNNLPTEVQYCQNFMIQIEQPTFDKLAKKEVNWNFSDLEQDGIYDMKVAMEGSFLFGSKGVIQHPTKQNMSTWFTGGIWNVPSKDIQIGTYDSQKKSVVVTDDDLVDITKSLFVGNGSGEKKIIIAGSEVVSALSKIKSEKFRLKESVEYWDIKFRGFETEFGDVYVIHHELFDLNKMSDKAFALDPTYLSKRIHLSWARNILDLKKAGVRNTDAVVIQEVCCLILRNPAAHARMFLAKSA